MMLPKKTDVAKQLSRIRDKEYSVSEFRDMLAEVLKNHTTQQQRIHKNLKQQGQGVINKLNIDQLQSKHIFHLRHIKKICIDYRLRFLSTSYFKGEIPEEAISAIKNLEATHQLELQGFKIIAPSKLFRLKDKDDPLLFVPLGNDYYYLVHKWGNDLHPLRKYMVWPFKNIVNLTITVAFLSYLTTMLVPEGLFSKQNTSAEFWLLFFFFFKSIAAVVLFYGFALGKNFNPAIWRSKYLK